MTLSTISTYGSLQSFLSQMNQLQNSLSNDQVQITSGQISQTFDGLNGNIEQFVSLNAQVTRLQNYQQGNQTVTSQLQATTNAINQTITIANTLKSLMVSQMSGVSNNTSFSQQVLSQRDAIIGQLNTSFQGNYVFSGSNTNTPPIASPMPTPVTVGVPDTSYYRGSTQNTTFRIADNQVIENTIRADDPAFQNVFAAIAMVTTGSKPGSGDIAKAENMLDQGIQALIALQATANSNIVRVQQVNTQSQSVQTYYQGLSDSISKSDPVAVSTKLAQDQTILQASFSAFARISSLTLASYLK